MVVIVFVPPNAAASIALLFIVDVLLVGAVVVIEGPLVVWLEPGEALPDVVPDVDVAVTALGFTGGFVGGWRSGAPVD